MRPCRVVVRSIDRSRRRSRPAKRDGVARAACADRGWVRPSQCEVAPDFFELFEVAAPLLDDNNARGGGGGGGGGGGNGLWCVSAWNDNAANLAAALSRDGGGGGGSEDAAAAREVSSRACARFGGYGSSRNRARS